MIITLIAALIINDPCTHTIHTKIGDVVTCGPADLVPLDRGQWLLACRTDDLPRAEGDLATCRRERADDAAACGLRVDSAEADARTARQRLDACRLRPVEAPAAPSVWATPAPWVTLALGLAAGAVLALALD